MNLDSDRVAFDLFMSEVENSPPHIEEKPCPHVPMWKFLLWTHVLWLLPLFVLFPKTFDGYAFFLGILGAIIAYAPFVMQGLLPAFLVYSVMERYKS